LSTETLAAVPIPALPWSAQRRIADFLDEQVDLLDAGIHEAQTLIALLQERKRSLLTAVVTGEFDVEAGPGRGKDSRMPLAP
jgi:restriction endonuclease S subunit